LSLALQVSQTRLRVAFVVESGTDVRLLEGLIKRLELEVVARKIANGVEISQAPSFAIPVTVGPSGRLKFGYFVAKYLFARRQSLDAILVQGYGVAALAANLTARWFGIPAYMLVCSPVEAYYECRKNSSEEGKSYRKHEAVLLRGLARLNAMCGQEYIVLSQYLADVVRLHGTRRPIEVVPVYGVDTAVFRPPEVAKSAIKASRSLPLDGALVFFSSRIAPEKDAYTLVAALRLVLDRGRNVRIVHRSGGFRSFLELAQQIGVASHVIATDAVHPVKELPLDYQACDLCVQASRAEGLGFSVLEALACGVPVIAAGVGGLKDTIIQGTTGWSYPPGDVAALAACIEDALDNPAEAQRRALRGRQLVLAEYESRIVFDKLTNLIAARTGGKTSSICESPA